MRWFSRSRLDVASVVSVVLSAAVGVVGNAYVGSWAWGLLVALVVLVICLATAEIIRTRAAARLNASSAPPADVHPPLRPSAEPQSGPTTSMTISQSRVSNSVFAGRNAYQLKVGSGGIFAFIGMLILALMLGGGATLLGRTDAAVPRHAKDDLPPRAGGGSRRTESPAPSTSQSFVIASPSATGSPSSPWTRSAGVTNGGRDLDPPGPTSGLADLSFDSREGGLSFLNGTVVAQLPAARPVTAELCRSAARYSRRRLAYRSRLAQPSASGVATAGTARSVLRQPSAARSAGSP